MGERESERERERRRERERKREREGEREKERERERERERKRERERERERDGESTLQDHIITMRWELHYIRVYPTIFSCLDPRYQLSRFFTGISRRNNGELISLIGNQQIGIFPPKSEILFVLSLALIWYRNFQDRTIPLGGDTWPCFWRKEGIIKRIIIRIRTRKTTYASVCKSRTKQTRKKVAGVTRQWTQVTRTSTDCQTTFLDVWSNLGKFWKMSLNGQATVVGGHATVGQLSNNVFRRFKRFGKILKKVAERSRDSGRGHATVGRLSNNVFWTFQAIKKNLKKVAERSRDSGRRSRDRRPTVKQRFLNVSSDLGKFWKKSLNDHATVVEVTRPSADCQTTFFGRFKRFGKILKKVAERSRDSGWGHATVGRLSNNVFWTFQAIWENFEKSRWTVTRQWSRSRDRRSTVKQRFWMFQAIRKFC